MEQAQKPKPDETPETNPSIVDPLGVSAESDQNQRPLPQRKFITDAKGESREVTPKVVESIPKPTTCAATDDQRRKRVLIETQQLQDAVSTSPSKESENVKEKSPKTLQEKKERYLRKANESKSHPTRAYLKKEFENTSIGEIVKSSISAQSESKKITGSTSLLFESFIGPNRTDEGVSSNINKSVESSRTMTPMDSDTSNTKKEKTITPYVEEHFAPEKPKNQMKNIPSTENLPNNKKDNAKLEEITGKTSKKEDVKLQDNEAETVSNVSSQGKMDEDVEIQPSSGVPAVQISSVELKDEEEIRKNDNSEICERNTPIEENAEDNLQIFSSQTEDKTDMERKSPDSSSGIDTDNSERDEVIKTDLLKTEIKSEIELEQINKSDSKSGMKDSFKNNQEMPSRLPLTDEQTKELATLMEDADLYARTAEAIRNSEPLSVVPNVKLRRICPIKAEAELPEKLKAQYQILGIRFPTEPKVPYPTSPPKVIVAYNPFDEESRPGSSSQAAGQSSDHVAEETDASETVDSHQVDTDKAENSNPLLNAILDKEPGYVTPITEQPSQVWFRPGADLKINSKYLPRPEYSDILPDDDNSDEVPDVYTKQKGLEILPNRRRGGIIRPEAPAPPPPLIPPPPPEREDTPEPEPEGESSTDPQSTDPQPSPEAQQDQTQEDHSTSEGPSAQNDEEDANSQPNPSEVEEMVLENDTPSLVQDISEPRSISKHIRQSENGVIMLLPGAVSAPVPVSPDLKPKTPKPVNPLGENQDEPMPPADGQQETTVNLDVTENTPRIVSPGPRIPEEPEPGNLETNGDEDKIKPAVEVEIDTCPVPARNILDEETPMMIPPPTPHDRDIAPQPEGETSRAASSELSGDLLVSNQGIQKESNRSHGYEVELSYLNNETIGPQFNRRRTISLNESHSPKFKPIYHPGTNNEYAEILNQEEVSRKKLEPKCGSDQNDHTDIEMPFESKSDEASMSEVNIPEPALPSAEITVETIPSSSQPEDECSANIPNQTESQEKESSKESESESARAPETDSVPGIISCTLPSGPEEDTRRNNPDSNQQDAADSRKGSKAEGISNRAGGRTAAGSGPNPDGSGSDDDDDDDKNNPKRPNEKFNEPRDDDSESDEEEDEDQEDEEHNKKNKTKPQESLTQSKSDESAPKKKEVKTLEERELSKSSEETMSCSREDELSTRSSVSSGEEYLQPIQAAKVDPLNADMEESIIVIKGPEEESSDEDDDAGDDKPPQASSSKRKEAPTPEHSEVGPSKLLAREDESGRTVAEPQEIEMAVQRPARITQRRQPVPIESDISDIDRGLSESGISEVDGSSDRDASAGEAVSETSEDYTARRRLTRNQAAQVEAHQQQRPGLISSGFDRENSSPSPEPETEPTAAKPSILLGSVTAYDSSDSGSTLLPKDSASSAKSSDKTLSSNSNEQASVPRKLPKLEDLNLPQDVEYDPPIYYNYRELKTSYPLAEVLDLSYVTHTDKRKRSSPLDETETKKIKTGDGDDQQDPSVETDNDGDVIMTDVKPEEPVSDSDREVAAIMAVPVKTGDAEEDEMRKALRPRRAVAYLIPKDNKEPMKVLLLPSTIRETSFVPYVPPKKTEKTPSKSDTLDSSKPAEKEVKSPEKSEKKAPLEKESTQAPKEEKTTSKEAPTEEKKTPTSKSKRASLEPAQTERRASLRNRESLEPQNKENSTKTKTVTPKVVETKATTRTNPWRAGRSTVAPNRPTEPANKRLSGGSCKEPTNKKTQRDDKDDPDSSSGKNTGRRQTRSPVKKPAFRR